MNAQPQEIEFKGEGPQPLLREIPKGEPYPVAALGPLREAVEAVQGESQAPVAIPAQSALAVAALAVQGFADVETLGGFSPVSLYALTIALSGERKSTCDKALLAPLWAYEREQDQARQADLETWKNSHAIWKAERERIMADTKKPDKRTAARADLEKLGPEPSPPPTADRTVRSPTYEGLTRQFREGCPALGIFSDEGGQFLGGYAMKSENRQSTLAALNDAWQGQPIKRTLNGEGSLTMYGRRLSVHLMVQPGVARTFMADPMAGDTGFLARFLVTEPPSTIGTRLASLARSDRAALEAFGARLNAILQTPLPIHPETRALETRPLHLAPDARALLVQFADAIEAEQAPGRSLRRVTGSASKIAEQAARIAGVLTLWRDLHAPQVDVATMADGIILAQFYLSEALRLADAATVSAEIERAETLRAWLLDSFPHREVTVRDVVQLGPNALREAPKAKAAIALLVTHNWLIPLERGTVIRGAARKEAWLKVGAENVV
ncbi:YfjI family protein [Paragemmobacter straminiformis]|uniref:DUF3987 domain-containing protein n=1 Tax=Paragemmobacter straminiformis TaxID=2045119 RepID=A0A842I9W4_9RHOB|nr:YfjI family protein [Gemmobacter straminiformis]MBC2836425.1 DUF3987 domain-containing protein [Gemmobacter straminiformis]